MECKTWSRDGYLVSTNPALLQLDAINDAFGSGLMFWTKRLSEDGLKKMVDSSFCLGLYALDGAAGDPGSEADLKMVGMSRVVTDYTTFGYLTDVYVLKEHQGQGLAKWMMECLNEVLNEWPDFRRLLLVTSNDFAIPLYRKTLGAEEWSKADVGTMKVLVKRGRAATKNVS